MKLEEKIEKYLNEAQQFDVGDFIMQQGNDFITYAQIVAKQKGGGHKVAAFTIYDDYKRTAGKAKFKSTKGWYPDPRAIDKKDIPTKVLKKILDKSELE